MTSGTKAPIANDGGLSSVRATVRDASFSRARIQVNLDPEDSPGEDTDRPYGDEQDNIVFDDHMGGKQFTGSTTNLVIEQSESEMEVPVESF